MKLKLSEIEKFVRGNRLICKDNLVITSCVIDSRKATEGSLFIPFKGENVDGYDYIEAAVSKGAKCILIERKEYVNPDLDCEYILVKDNAKALQELASEYRNKLGVTVIGITGSNGKTTTKDLVAAVTSEKNITLKTQGNLNNHLGLPLTLLDCNDNEKFAVLEMGMSDIGEIDLLSKISRPDIGIITNIGESHIENLKSKENIAKAKSELFNHISLEGIAILNGDDPYLLNLAPRLTNVLKYGFSNNNDIFAKNIRTHEQGMEFEVEGMGINTSFRIPIFGEHNVMNSLAAILVGLKLDLSVKEIQQGLEKLEMTSMRTEVVDLPLGIKLINDCYNASEASAKAALKVLNDLGEGKTKIAYLGDMLELGGYTERAHYNVGAYAVQMGVDKIVAVGNNIEFIRKGAIDYGFKGIFLAFKNSLEATKEIRQVVEPNSAVLIKGSRGMKMEVIVEEMKEEF